MEPQQKEDACCLIKGRAFVRSNGWVTCVFSSEGAWFLNEGLNIHLSVASVRDPGTTPQEPAATYCWTLGSTATRSVEFPSRLLPICVILAARPPLWTAILGCQGLCRSSVSLGLYSSLQLFPLIILRCCYLPLHNF